MTHMQTPPRYEPARTDIGKLKAKCTKKYVVSRENAIRLIEYKVGYTIYWSRHYKSRIHHKPHFEEYREIDLNLKLEN